VAVSLAAFQRYQAEDAWSWERMAMTRARVVAGPPALARRIGAAIRAALGNPEKAKTAIADALAMRARMLRELPGDGPWDVKLSPGGLVEVEFIAQALQLHHAPRHPEVLATTTRIALANLAKMGALTAEEAQDLISAERLWRGISGILRLTLGPWREDKLPEPAASAVLRVAAPLCPTPPVDLPGLRAQMEASAALVRSAFEARLGRLDEGSRT
jgi:glutamate-ammonia-ligase adenylyltransferase